MALSRLGPDLNELPVPRSQESAPPVPTSSLYTTRSGCKGVGKGSPVVVIVGAASPGAYQPLTDLGKCPSGERAQGTCHSCAALAPVQVGWHRAPGDTAAQGRGRGPQLGAHWRRSPSAGRPGLDTVYASFCREYLNACSSTRKMHQR